LLLAAIRMAIDGRPPLDEAGAQSPNVSWISFMTLALQHQVGGLALAGLRRMPDVTVPPPVLAQLTKLSKEILNQRAVAIQELHRIAEALGGAGIEMIPIKGPLLRQRLFGEIAAGPSRDLDFLISPRTANAAFEILARCGYHLKGSFSPRQFRSLLHLYGQELLQRDDGRFVIEPHFAILPSNLGTHVDHEAMWHRARLSELEGTTIRFLEPEDEFLLLAVHGSKEFWGRLKWLADLAKLTAQEPRIDWEVVFERATQQGVRRMVCLAVLLLAETFRRKFSHVPIGSQDKHFRMIARRIAAGWERPRDAPSVFNWSWTRFFLCDHAAARAAYFFRTVMTPREAHFCLAKLPDSMFAAYYVIKVVHDYALWPSWVLLKRTRVFASRLKTAAPQGIQPRK
jgi:hypothetical protein